MRSAGSSKPISIQFDLKGHLEGCLQFGGKLSAVITAVWEHKVRAGRLSFKTALSDKAGRQQCVTATRNCKWDLWRRPRRRSELRWLFSIAARSYSAETTRTVRVLRDLESILIPVTTTTSNNQQLRDFGSAVVANLFFTSSCQGL